MTHQKQSAETPCVNELTTQGLMHDVRALWVNIIEQLSSQPPSPTTWTHCLSHAQMALAWLDALLSDPHVNHEQVFKPSQILSSLVHLLQPMAKQHRSQLNITLPTSLQLRVKGHVIAWQRILFNLIYNAITHHQKIDIDVALTQTIEGHHAHLITTVKDSGPGIDPKQLPHVFQPGFSQSSSHQGLGLAICQQLIENLQGELSLQSEPSGCEFTVKTTFLIEKKAMSLAYSNHDRHRPCRLLVIDDDRITQQWLKHYADEHDVIYHSLRHGSDHRRLPSWQHYDLVLIDFHSIPMTSIESWHDELQHTVANWLLTSSYLTPEEENQLKHCNINTWIKKPFSTETLASHLIPHQFKTGSQNDLIDWDNTLIKTQGSYDLAFELLNLFIQDATTTITHMNTSLSAHQWEQLDFQIHHMEGGLGYCVIPSWSDELQHLKQCCQHRDHRQAIQHLNVIQQIAQDLIHTWHSS